MKISPLKWTTKKVEDIIEQIDKTSVIPKYSPFYDRQYDLRAPDLNYGYTEEELHEKTKSAIDIFYFAQKYCHIQTGEEGIQLIQLRDYQKRVLHDLAHPLYRFNIFLASRQIGKCVSPYTIVEIDGHKIPIFEVYYQTKPNLTPFDYIVYGLMKLRFYFCS